MMSRRVDYEPYTGDPEKDLAYEKEIGRSRTRTLSSELTIFRVSEFSSLEAIFLRNGRKSALSFYKWNSKTMPKKVTEGHIKFPA